MVNCRAFATVCSIICVGSCIGSLFLLSTVNPPKLDQPPVLDVQDSEKIHEENPLDSLAPFYRYRHNLVHKLASAPKYATLAESVDPDESTEEPLFIIPPEFIRNVSPPARHFPNSVTTTAVSSITKTIRVDVENTSVETIINEDYKSILMPPVHNTSSSPPKKGHRRSVTHNEYRGRIIDTNASTIVMKIIDNSGQPRIEIKINSEGSNLLNHDPDMVLIVQKDNIKHDAFGLGHNTEMKILPNDTVIVKDINSKKEHFDAVSEIYENVTTNITSDIDNTFKLNPLLDTKSMSTRHEKENNGTIITNALLKDIKQVNKSNENTPNKTELESLLLKNSVYSGISKNNTEKFIVSEFIQVNRSNVSPTLRVENTTSIVNNITKNLNISTSRHTKENINMSKTISRTLNYTEEKKVNTPITNITVDYDKIISLMTSKVQHTTMKSTKVTRFTDLGN